MTLVAGVDSSTQSCKIVIRDAATGALVREAKASHPDGSEVHPDHWWTALNEVIDAVGGLDDVAALSVGGQQHGMVVLDAEGEVIRPALLWNDTRSAGAARDLISELGDGDEAAGRRGWADAVGSVLVASLTITKLRWLADHEPENAARIAAVCLPHDWLTWKLSGATSLDTLVTDRSDASGTGYFDSVANTYRRDLLALALHRTEAEVRDIVLPRVVGPNEVAARGGVLTTPSGKPRDLSHLVLGPGCGDNAGAALGLGLRPGQTSVSLGTSGVVAAVSTTPTHDASGLVTGFADATGAFLPLACTLNASRILDAAKKVLGVSYDEFDALALSAEPGAGGLVHVPYLEGERTPNLPEATGMLTGMTLASLTPANYARAAVEGLLCLMGAGVDAVRAQGVTVDAVTLVGGGVKWAAARELAPAILGVPVDVPEPGEYVANGAAKQAAWVLDGGAQPPVWELGPVEHMSAEPQPEVRAAYDAAAAIVAASQQS
ncbi:xylulokinase [Actinomyces sp. MRS3W]|uniref:xylulokinase n=1 Tax=Actinomyces sp. MRS3W TaxID=2800796 RepID=UPI0028FD28E8|nr:FGGY family carbohydrate kinase [Actinomyces sp. MRS3W]MDU0347718.1 FGGY family carbohydrate kinase [Actinomyces sp. MRS3W]